MTISTIFQSIDKKWQPVHLLLVKHQQLVKKIFWILPATIVGLIVLAVYTRFNLDSYGWIYYLGTKLGVIAFLLYLASFIPGILQRFRILPMITATSNLFRRQMGVLMFYTAVAHLAIVSSIPKIFAYGSINLGLFGQKEISGLVGMLILFPVWLTSNDFSIKKLGKFWKLIQRLTYLALMFIFVHVALMELELAIIGLFAMLVIVASWVFKWVKKD